MSMIPKKVELWREDTPRVWAVPFHGLGLWAIYKEKGELSCSAHLSVSYLQVPRGSLCVLPLTRLPAGRDCTLKLEPKYLS